MPTPPIAPEIARLQARITQLEAQLARLQREGAGVTTRGGSPIGGDQLQAVFENYSGGMVFSSDGVILDANTHLARMLGVEVKALIGKRIVDFVAPEDREAIRKRIAEGATEPNEHHLVRADGTAFPVEVTASTVPTDGPLLRFTVLRDISDRRRAGEELDRQRRTLQAIIDNVPVGVFVAEAPSCRPLLANKRLLELLHTHELPEADVERLAPTYSMYVRGTNELYPVERMPLIRALSGETSSVDDLEVHHADGTRTLFQVHGAPIRDAHGKIVMSVVTSQDITARKQAEQALLDGQEFLRGLIRAHERDRQLMAYDIHDGLVQYIIGAVWQIESLGEDESLSNDARRVLNYSQDLLRKAIAEARRVLSGLRPPVLDEKGILIAIDYLTAEAAQSGELQVAFTHNVQFSRLEPILEGTIFRIVQESLSNVRKHSGATHATVRLEQRGERVVLTVHDNGRGFQASQVPRDRFGLQGIRKRAELAGGSVNVDTSREQGTTIQVDLPLVTAPDDHARQSL